MAQQGSPEALAAMRQAVAFKVVQVGLMPLALVVQAVMRFVKMAILSQSPTQARLQALWVKPLLHLDGKILINACATFFTIGTKAYDLDLVVVFYLIDQRVAPRVIERLIRFKIRP